MYIGTPLYNMIMLDDEQNIAKKNEKSYYNNKQYWVPLWVTIFV